MCATCQLQPRGQRSSRQQEASPRSLLPADQLCGQHHPVCSGSIIMPELITSDGSSYLVVEFSALCRYLESCTGSTLKRKSDSHSRVNSSSSSSTSEEDKPAGAADTAQASSDGIHLSHRLCWRAIMSNSSSRVKFTFSWLFLLLQWCWTVGCRWPPLQLQLLEHLWRTSPCPLRPWVWSLSPASVPTAAPLSMFHSLNQVHIRINQLFLLHIH